MVALANSKVQYVGSVEWTAVAAWATGVVTAAGALIRQTAPTLGNERVFACIIAGTTGATEPTWAVTAGAKTAEAGGPTWQEVTGGPGVNGDIVNPAVWGATLTVTLGQIIYDSVSGALQIVTTAGATKALPAPTFSATAGTTTADNTATWTSLGLASNFGPWAAPHKRILNADASTWQTVTPATIYIASDHAETQTTAITFSGGQGTSANPNKYLCVSNAVAPPTAVTTGASVATTGASTLGVGGSGYWYGITFSSGSAANTASLNIGSSSLTYFDNCGFVINNTSASSGFIMGTSATGLAKTYYNACTVTFGATSQGISVTSVGGVVWEGGSMAATGSVPSTLFSQFNNTYYGKISIRDADLSAITGTLLNMASTGPGELHLENCKLGVGVAMTTGTALAGGRRLFLHNCDSGNKNYRFYEAEFLATIQQETTIVDNTNQATDGTTQISWNIASGAGVAFGQPYQAPEITQWNDLTAGSHTATIQINSNSALTNADIWMELEYPGSALTPIGSVVSNRAAPLATPTTHTTSTDSWGGALSNQQQMSVTFSPAMKGPVKVRVYVAKPSLTVYVNPLIIVA